ncbi:MAG: TMEM14 family protein [Verrucomicrobiae bacterium]|nr:TMEM14 family protein [Verrucomicrobiae bacterium]MDW8307991.1 TMEM14 family protein [Verrucomicrobiales bacterium]
MQEAVLWIYIVLLVVGGLVGFLRAGSRASLISSVAFAAALVLCAIPGIFDAHFRHGAVNVLLAALLVVFAVRLGKTRKFIPAGLMLALTLLTLALRNIRF